MAAIVQEQDDQPFDAPQYSKRALRAVNALQRQLVDARVLVGSGGRLADVARIARCGHAARQVLLALDLDKERIQTRAAHDRLERLLKAQAQPGAPECVKAAMVLMGDAVPLFLESRGLCGFGDFKAYASDVAEIQVGGQVGHEGCHWFPSGELGTLAWETASPAARLAEMAELGFTVLMKDHHEGLGIIDCAGSRDALVALLRAELPSIELAETTNYVDGRGRCWLHKATLHVLKTCELLALGKKMEALKIPAPQAGDQGGVAS